MDETAVHEAVETFRAELKRGLAAVGSALTPPEPPAKPPGRKPSATVRRKGQDDFFDPDAPTGEQPP